MTTTSTAPDKIRIVCISDTHGYADGEGYKLPPGDILIHAGDLTNQGTLPEFQKAARWLEASNYATKIIIAGNHDLSLDDQYSLKHVEGWTVTSSNSDACKALIRGIKGVTYLEHEQHIIKVKGHSIRIFGSPYSVDNLKQNWAFQYCKEDAQSVWSTMPEDTDILITHTPPQGILDKSDHWIEGGCPALLEEIQRVRPVLHVFGHHHEGRGACTVTWTPSSTDHHITPWSDPGVGNRKQSIVNLKHLQPDDRSTTAINGSIMKTSWTRSARKEFNKAIVVDLPLKLFACG